MVKFFTTEGPIKKDIHYFIDPLSRINLDQVLSLVHSQKYFVLHAPRQTGKTSYLLAAWKKPLKTDWPKPGSIWISVEPGKVIY